MFQSLNQRIRALLDVVDDMLAGAPEPELPPHPHRRPVQLRMQRRAGTVAPRAMHCLSPARPPALQSPTAPERDLTR